MIMTLAAPHTDLHLCACAYCPALAQNAQLWVVVGAALLLLLYFVLGLVCGFTLQNC